MAENKKVPQHPDSPCATCQTGELVCNGTSRCGCREWHKWFRSEWRKIQEALRRDEENEEPNEEVKK